MAKKRDIVEQKAEQPAPLRIAIVGTAPGSLPSAPFSDDSWQIWGCSTNPHALPRWDRWIEIHDLKRKRAVHPKYYDWMCQKHDKPIYLHHTDPKVPDGVPYPRSAVVKRFGNYARRVPDGLKAEQPVPDDYTYVTNSISYLIALALMEIEAHPTGGEIGIWGVDMAVGGIISQAASEYSHQRPSCEYFIGLAHGMGVPCFIPAESDLLKNREMYGFDTDNNPMYWKIRARVQELTQRRAECAAKLAEAEKMLHMTGGSLYEVDEMLGNGIPDELRPHLDQRKEMLTRDRMQAEQLFNEARQGMNSLDGALTNMDWVKQGCPV